MTEVKFFSSQDKPWGPLSPQYRRPVEFEGQTFGNAEAAYQWGKVRAETSYQRRGRDWIFECPIPAYLKILCDRLPPYGISAGWSAARMPRMKAVQLAKFSQHDDLRALLLATGQARIIHECRMANRPTGASDWYDAAFEFGEFMGKGLNKLGIILMEVRGELGGHGVIERE